MSDSNMVNIGHAKNDTYVVCVNGEAAQIAVLHQHASGAIHQGTIVKLGDDFYAYDDKQWRLLPRNELTSTPAAAGDEEQETE